MSIDLNLYYSRAQLAKEAGRSGWTILDWEKKKLIPKGIVSEKGSSKLYYLKNDPLILERIQACKKHDRKKRRK